MTPFAASSHVCAAALVGDRPSDERVLIGDSPEVRGLISAAQAGDRTAFGGLVSRYHRSVFRTAMAALQRTEDADDATQDAFLLAWRKIGAFRGESSFKTWLLTIVWRQALDRRRARGRWWQRTSSTFRTHEAPDGHNDALDQLVSHEADPERHAAGRDRVRHVRQAIAGLSPKLRDTLLLAASGDHSYEEIATVLGVPVGTVKWRVSEARRLVSQKCESPHE